jgi:formylglycine-generating enzyme required for sulfatase activity
VWEWVADSYHGNYAGAPTDGSAWQGGDEERRMLRGGSWLSDALSTRAAYRFGSATAEHNSAYGFRVARMLP